MHLALSADAAAGALQTLQIYKLLTALNSFSCMGVFSENCYQLTFVEENLH